MIKYLLGNTNFKPLHKMSLWVKRHISHIFRSSFFKLNSDSGAKKINKYRLKRENKGQPLCLPLGQESLFSLGVCLRRRPKIIFFFFFFF
jgi:hypothetical protein